MEVLACIPELSRPVSHAIVPPPVAENRRLGVPAPAPIAASMTSTPAMPAEPAEPAVADDAMPDEAVAEEAVAETDLPAADPDVDDDTETVSPGPRRDTVRAARGTWLFSPSIVALAVVATVVWAAAWRNDRLRLEAARQQRPERLAQELPPSAGVARSVTP